LSGIKELLTKSVATFRIIPTGQCAMIHLSLREAAQQAGTSKSTILRAIQSGRLSASKNDVGGYNIDPAELFRVFPAKRKIGPAERSNNDALGHGAPANETVATEAGQVAALEVQIKLLREMVDEIKSQRDGWQQQAERLAITNQTERPTVWKRLFG
jgi:hypothetical protein